MSEATSLSPADYRVLASFRRSLRRFLDFSAKAARNAGLTTQHYQALLALKAADPSKPLTIGDIADELLLRHHSAVELVNRLANRDLVRGVASPADGRRVAVQLTRRGEATIASLAEVHREELRRVGPEFRHVLGIMAEQKR